MQIEDYEIPADDRYAPRAKASQIAAARHRDTEPTPTTPAQLARTPYASLILAAGAGLLVIALVAMITYQLTNPPKVMQVAPTEIPTTRPTQIPTARPTEIPAAAPEPAPQTGQGLTLAPVEQPFEQLLEQPVEFPVESTNEKPAPERADRYATAVARQEAP